jgi:hypothetical protein
LRKAQLEVLEKTAFDDLDEKFYALKDSEAGGFESAADAFAENASQETA